MKNDFKPVARKENVVVQELDGEVLIYDLGTNKAFCLNETSSLVWQACDGEKNVSELSRELTAKLNSPANEDLIWLALDQLKKEKLIESKEDFQIDFNGMSRRDVIKKVGLASVIALPIITGLVAPKAANAASVACNTGATCTCPAGSAGTSCGAGVSSGNCNAQCTTCTGIVQGAGGTCGGVGGNCAGTCA